MTSLAAKATLLSFNYVNEGPNELEVQLYQLNQPVDLALDHRYSGSDVDDIVKYLGLDVGYAAISCILRKGLKSDRVYMALTLC